MLLLPASAAADTGDDSGLPLGQLVVKPSLSVDIIYDSNVYRTQQAPQADLGLQFIPAVRLVYPGDNFRWDLYGRYRGFTYFSIAGRNHDLLRDFTNFSLGTSFDVNRQGKFGFWFAPSFSNRRAPRGPDESEAEGSDLGYELTIETPLEFRLRPTKAFQVKIDGHWEYTRAYFPNAVFDPNPFVLGQPHDVGGGLGLDWRFFPRSHLLVDLDVGHVFQGTFDAANRHDDPVANTYWRAQAGLKGDVTRKLSMMGMIGYGNVYLGETQGQRTILRPKNLTGIDGLIGKAEIAVRPILTQRIAVGFKRDFYFRYFAYHITDMQAYFKYKGLIAGRLAIHADFSYTFRDIEGDESDGIADGIPRTENQWTVGAGVEVMLAEWFQIVANYRFSAVNPSSVNTGEYIDNRVKIGIVLGFR